MTLSAMSSVKSLVYRAASGSTDPVSAWLFCSSSMRFSCIWRTRSWLAHWPWGYWFVFRVWLYRGEWLVFLICTYLQKAPPFCICCIDLVWRRIGLCALREIFPRISNTTLCLYFSVVPGVDASCCFTRCCLTLRSLDCSNLGLMRVEFAFDSLVLFPWTGQNSALVQACVLQNSNCIWIALLFNLAMKKFF